MLALTKPSELLLVDDIDEASYDALVARRAARVPLQHLTGTAPFRYLELEVGPGVFVPRPETESVVQAVVDHLARLGRFRRHAGAGHADEADRGRAGPVVVDLCAGSGAIALSVAHEVPGAVVHAVELSADALAWARGNDPRDAVTWHHGPVEGCLPDLDGTVDVVVSNPPYVPDGTEIDRETAEHDPALALWGGPDGLDVVRQVEAAARRLLKPGGLLVVEHSDRQGESAPAVFVEAGGWVDVADHEDLTGRPRYVTARWQT